MNQKIDALHKSTDDQFKEVNAKLSNIEKMINDEKLKIRINFPLIFFKSIQTRKFSLFYDHTSM